MSTMLYSVSGPGGNDASLQGTTVGGSKPLHRFMKGQPKIIGVIVLVLGSAFLIMPIAISEDFFNQPLSITIPSGFLQGILCIICGIMYILTEHNPTKKTVTISLALSIVSIVAATWCGLLVLPAVTHRSFSRQYVFPDDNITETEEAVWPSHYEAMEISLEGIFVFYSFLSAIIFIVMSTLAGIALRSPKSQAIVVMTAAPTETPAE
ncbi:membrane-spanning 4-domains subfamily A member 4A-like [Paralichthys olivaceus]|uniref:membrane-spanning 4-domains subfamily A member 4A-like n=1 Tax=Paralichthys olivaceus TaxID=8255 RepID=UPI00097DE1EC|nr:PREDICTED: uncharacterized protein LOC109624801 [Paralichthys olivaceus]